MLQLTFQTFALILLGFSVGLVFAWLTISAKRNATEKKLQHELASTRVNFQNTREDAHKLRGQIKLAEEQKSRLLNILESTSGHKDFLEVRRKLELARREIQLLKTELNRHAQDIFDLKDVIHTLRKHLRIRPIAPHQSKPNNVVKLPVLDHSEDNLQMIEGVTKEIAHQLRSLGIVSYRQIAECTPEQLNNIQRLIGGKQKLPLRQWVMTANHLFQKKYTTLRSDLHKKPPRTA